MLIVEILKILHKNNKHHIKIEIWENNSNINKILRSIDTIKNKNFYKLIEIALSNFKEVKSIVKNCLDNEPILKAQKEKMNEVVECIIACEQAKACLVRCKDILNMN